MNDNYPNEDQPVNDEPVVPQFPTDRVELTLPPVFPSDRVEKGENSGEINDKER